VRLHECVSGHTIHEIFSRLRPRRLCGFAEVLRLHWTSRACDSAEIVALAAWHRLPAIYFFRRRAAARGLLAFGPDQAGFWRTAGRYVGRILNGERPDDLPVQQPTKCHLTVNLKTAAALGITVPPSIPQVDEVIE
jgi:hypothetical protein